MESKSNDSAESAIMRRMVAPLVAVAVGVATVAYLYLYLYLYL